MRVVACFPVVQANLDVLAGLRKRLRAAAQGTESSSYAHS